jgi:nucleotide-binding universal stress UspA family protein
MFRKILVPTDGSNEATAAGHKAIDLAKLFGAAVVVVHVARPFEREIYEDFMAPPETTRESWQAGMRTVAERYFKVLRETASAKGVPLNTDVAFDRRPSEAICEVAKAQGCDLIVIGPRGRSGIADHLLGSVTTRVLGATKIPVLVYRPPTI